MKWLWRWLWDDVQMPRWWVLTATLVFFVGGAETLHGLLS